MNPGSPMKKVTPYLSGLVLACVVSTSFADGSSRFTTQVQEQTNRPSIFQQVGAAQPTTVKATGGLSAPQSTALGDAAPNVAAVVNVAAKTAQTAAQNAQNTANVAKNAANNAQNTANYVNGRADTLQNEINNLNNQVASAGSGSGGGSTSNGYWADECGTMVYVPIGQTAPRGCGH